MATPHVAGPVLYCMSVEGILGTDTITKRILGTAAKDKVGGNLRGSPNLLADNNNSKGYSIPLRRFGRLVRKVENVYSREFLRVNIPILYKYICVQSTPVSCTHPPYFKQA